MELNDKNDKIKLGEFMRPVDYKKSFENGGGVVLGKKLSIPQLLITVFWVVTLITISDALIVWDKPIYHGMFAGGLFIVGIVIAKLKVKDK